MKFLAVVTPPSIYQNRSPSYDCRCTASTYMFSKVRQGGNDKLHHNKFSTVSDTNSSTRENVGALKATKELTRPVKGKETNN